MKRLIILIITSLLLSCSGDGNYTGDYQQLEHVEVTVSNDEDFFLEFNYSNGDMLKTVYKNQVKISDITYDNEGKMTKITDYRDGEISSQKIFTYDDIGNIISVHDFNSAHTPKHQDREVTWDSNTMNIPYISEDRIDMYQFTFNDEGLLVNFKDIIQSAQNYVILNANYEYDENDNVIRKYGTYDETEYNEANYYDDKNNPYYPYLKKYYKNMIAIGKGGMVWGLNSSMQTFGKNNSLNAKNLITNTYNPGYFEHSYNRNTTIQSKLKTTDDDSFIATYDFLYE